MPGDARDISGECCRDFPAVRISRKRGGESVASEQPAVAVAERDDPHASPVALGDELGCQNGAGGDDDGRIDAFGQRKDSVRRHDGDHSDPLHLELVGQTSRAGFRNSDEDRGHEVEPIGTTERTEPPVIAASTSATSARSITTSAVVPSAESIPSAFVTDVTMASATRIRGGP